MDIDNSCIEKDIDTKVDAPQNLLVFQQNESGKSKIKGVIKYGENLFSIKIISIDTPLPPIIEDTSIYLSEDFSADLVLDFLKHPDLSNDLARLCHKKKIPIVASGKKHMDKWAITPPT